MERAWPSTEPQVDPVDLVQELAKYDPTVIVAHLRGDRSALQARIAAYKGLCVALSADGQEEAAAKCRRQGDALDYHLKILPSIGFVEAPCPAYNSPSNKH